MREIANLGSGTYNFIPDAGFVGTVFVNVTANVLSTMARDTIVNVEPQPGTTVLPVPGRHRYTECGAGAVVIHLGPVQYGQTKDIVIRLQSAAPAAAPAASLSARYTVVGDLTVTIASSRDTVVDNADADVLRLGAVDAILDGMALVEGNDSNAARSRIADHIVSVKRSASAAALADLLVGPPRVEWCMGRRVVGNGVRSRSLTWRGRLRKRSPATTGTSAGAATTCRRWRRPTRSGPRSVATTSGIES